MTKPVVSDKDINDNDTYCGFVCSDIIDKQNKILEEINDFSKVNREFAIVMLNRLSDLIYNSKVQLAAYPYTTAEGARYSASSHSET